MSQDRFILSNMQFDSPDASRIKGVLTDLLQQINAAKIPIVVGPGDKYPEGMLIGQPVLDWSTGISVLKVFNGKQLI